MQNKGNRYPGMEGKVKAMISKLWDLSQLHGTPSLHRPSGRMVAGSLAGSHASAWPLSKARSSSKMPPQTRWLQFSCCQGEISHQFIRAACAIGTRCSLGGIGKCSRTPWACHPTTRPEGAAGSATAHQTESRSLISMPLGGKTISINGIFWEQQRHMSPIWQFPNFNLKVLRLDWLHVVDLGCAQDAQQATFCCSSKARCLATI